MNINLGLDIASGGGRVRYLFRDEFTTDREAGAVNNTSCEPGPGSRAIRDVESKITVTDGWLKFDAQSTAVYAEEDIILGAALTRAAGYVDIRQYKVTTDEKHYPLALVTSATPTWNHTHVDAGLWRSAANTLSVIAGAALKGTVATTAADGTIYYLACVLRSTGAFYYIKGGAFTNWTLLYCSITGNTATLYRAAAGNLAVFYLGFERNSAARWVPVPGLNDGFGTSFGISDGLGTIETTGIGSGGANVTWTGSTWSVSGGKASVSPCLGSELLVNGGFDSDTDWTKQSGWTINTTTKIAEYNGASPSSVYQQKLVPHKWYKVQFDVESISAGKFYVNIGGNYIFNPGIATTDVYYATNRSPADYVGVTAGNAATTGSVDDVSAKQLYLPSLVSFPAQSSTANPWCEGVWSAKVDGTQWGYLTNCDTNFAATVAATQAIGTTEITLTNVSKAITANDSLLDKANSILYGIASVGELSGTTQTITLDAPGLTAELAAGEVGIDYASWNGILTYYDGAGNCKCDQILNGTYTNLASTAITFSATARLIVRIGVGAATNVDIYYAEAKVGNTLTKDASITGKYHGLFSTDSGNTVNNFVVYATDGVTPLNAFVN